MSVDLSTDPEHIAISKSQGISIDWKDGYKSTYGNEYLRDHCPCAGCTGAHGTAPRPKTSENPLKMFTPKPKMVSVEPVGNYAIRIHWNDGHATGIYSFAHLRKISPSEAVASVELGTNFVEHQAPPRFYDEAPVTAPITAPA